MENKKIPNHQENFVGFLHDKIKPFESHSIPNAGQERRAAKLKLH